MKITTVSEKGLYQVTLYGEYIGDYDNVMYMGEKCILYIEPVNDSAKNYSQYSFNDNIYHTDKNGNLQIDITDFLKINSEAIQVEFDIRRLDNNDFCYFSIVNSYGINPKTWARLLPECDTSGDLDVVLKGLCMLPPNIMYKDSIFGKGTIWQVYGTNSDGNDTIQWFYVTGNTTPPQIQEANNMIVLPANASSLLALSILSSGFILNSKWTLKELDCDKKYAMIEWTALAGISSRIGKVVEEKERVRKRAIFEVSEIKLKSGNSTSLLTATNGYNVLKEKEIEITCRIDGLTAYGVAYYSDVITSDNVHAILSPDEDLSSPETQVYVTTSDLELPNGNQFYTLTFNIKYKHYGIN